MNNLRQAIAQTALVLGATFSPGVSAQNPLFVMRNISCDGKMCTALAREVNSDIFSILTASMQPSSKGELDFTCIHEVTTPQGLIVQSVTPEINGEFKITFVHSKT